MDDEQRYGRFDPLNAPIIAATGAGKIVYHNKAAGSVSRYIRKGCSLLSFLERGTVGGQRPTLDRLHFPDGASPAVLLIRDGRCEGARVLIVTAPMLEGSFCYARSGREEQSDFPQDGPPLPEAKDLTPLGRALLRAYAKLPVGFYLKDERASSVGSACIFLNRLFERVFAARKPAAHAKCTADCADFLLENFVKLSSCLAYLSVMTAVNAGKNGLEVCFHCENERPHILFSYETDRAPAEKLTDLFPDRRVELTILEALLTLLGYGVRIDRDERAKKTVVELSGETPFPAHLFKAPDEETRRIEELLAAELLLELVEE